MSRAKRPLNKEAVKKADAEFHTSHPELKGKPFSGSDPAQTELRKEWVILYEKNGGEVENPVNKPPQKPKDIKTKYQIDIGSFATADDAAKGALKK